MLRKVLHRAWSDTMSYLGSHKEVFVGAPLIFFFGAVANLVIKGPTAMPDLISSAIAGLAAVGCGFMVLFLGNLACAPFRMERERAVAAESELEKLRTQHSVEMPIGHLKAMQRIEHALSDCENRVKALSLLIKHFRSLAEKPDGLSLSEIAATFTRVAQEFIVPLPHLPEHGLQVQIGWNHYLQVFQVPKVIPPEITIIGLPREVQYEVSAITRLSFEVRFFPSEIEVKAFGYEANVGA